MINYLAKNAHDTQTNVKYVTVLTGDKKKSVISEGGLMYHIRPLVTLPFSHTPNNFTKIDLLNLE